MTFCRIAEYPNRNLLSKGGKLIHLVVNYRPSDELVNLVNEFEKFERETRETELRGTENKVPGERSNEQAQAVLQRKPPEEYSLSSYDLDLRYIYNIYIYLYREIFPDFYTQSENQRLFYI